MNDYDFKLTQTMSLISKWIDVNSMGENGIENLSIIKKLLSEASKRIAELNESTQLNVEYIFVHDWANWVATDFEGDTYEYENKPIMSGIQWIDPLRGKMEEVNKQFDRWTESLIKRDEQ